MASYSFQHRRGTTAEHAIFVGLIGEITFDTDLNTLRVHDGTTPGGYILSSFTNTSIDGLIIGATSSAAGTFSELTSDLVDLNGGEIDDTVIGATTSAAGTFSELTSDLVDLNSGEIDGTIIGANSSAAGTFSELTSDLVDLNGGEIDDTTIGMTVSSSAIFTTMTSDLVDINGGEIDDTTIGMTVSSSAIFTTMTSDLVDINGGTMDGTIIGDDVPERATVTDFVSTGITDTATTATQLVLTDTSATFANDVTVGGNLIVSGTTTSINAEMIELADNIIVLNSNATGLPTENAGIEIERGSEPNVSFYWDETGDTWTVNGEKLTVGEFEISQDAYVHDTVRIGRGPNDDISNTVLGTLVFDSNISGGQNVAVGAYAMFNNTMGDNNTAVGREALRNNITGHKNTAIGGDAGNWITSADENTMIGYEAQPVNLNSPHQLTIQAGPVKWASGFGTPEGMVEGLVGSMYTDQDGGIGSTFYVKEHGTGPTGGSSGWRMFEVPVTPSNGAFEFLSANFFELGGSDPLTDIDTDLNTVSAFHDSLPTALAVKTYVDTQVTAQDLDFQADTGGALSIDLDSEIITFTGGYGINTTGAANDVTFAIDTTETADLTTAQTLENKTLESAGDVTVLGTIDNSQQTGAMMFPSGTTAQRPAAPVEGMVRFNNEDKRFEGYNGTEWINIDIPDDWGLVTDPAALP